MAPLPCRIECEGTAEARSDLGGTARTRPPWLQSEHSLPFRSLTSDEFEVLAFLLLSAELAGKDSRVLYYGKTADLGRDILIQSPTTELVQCKHYTDRVGVGSIRVELAKLYANTSSGAIPKPNRVAFYVTTDLTAPAIDLLHDRNRWVDVAPKALAEYLGTEPPQDLVDLAVTWWPDPIHVTGIQLTERLRVFPSLIEEFFAQRAVVTGDISEVVEVQDSIQNKLDLLISLNQQNASAGLAELLARAEKDNPGLNFVAEVSAGGEATYKVSVKRGRGPVPIGTLRFGNVAHGALGAEKFKNAVEQGRSVELMAGEFEWSPAYKLPGKAASTTSLVITPSVPKARVPVRVECSNGDRTDIIDICYLSPTRLGTREMELELSHGQLAGSLTVILRSPPNDSGHDMSLSLDLGTLPAAKAVKTVKLVEGMMREGSVLTVFALEFDSAPLFELHGLSVSLGPLEGTRKLLEDLATISSAYSVDLRFPDGLPDMASVNHAEILAAGVRHGRVAIRAPNDVMAVQATETMARDIYNAITVNGAKQLQFGATDQVFNMFGLAVPAGALSTYLINPELIESNPPMPAAASADSETIYNMILRCSQVVYEFARWMPHDK